MVEAMKMDHVLHAPRSGVVAESDGSRTANPKQAGHQSDEAGQLVTTG